MITLESRPESHLFPPFLPLLVVVPHLRPPLAAVLRPLTPHLAGDDSRHLRKYSSQFSLQQQTQNWRFSFFNQFEEN